MTVLGFYVVSGPAQHSDSLPLEMLHLWLFYKYELLSESLAYIKFQMSSQSDRIHNFILFLYTNDRQNKKTKNQQFTFTTVSTIFTYL